MSAKASKPVTFGRPLSYAAAQAISDACAKCAGSKGRAS